MGGGAAGGLRRHQQWSPSWILPRIFCALPGAHQMEPPSSIQALAVNPFPTE